MKRFSRLITGFVTLMLMGNSVTVWGQGGGREGYNGPFRVKIELAPDVAGVQSRYLPFTEMLSLPEGKDNGNLLRRDTGENREYLFARDQNGEPRSVGEGLLLSRVRLSFSRYVLDQRGRDSLRPDTDGDDTLSKIRSLPSMLDSGSARETLGAIGEVFKPQLNLEINF
ncbi:MAG: hypothetical protein HY742_07015 [Deltaproteobacteria bacterium]|nr:hypothetical protein [Deltaproteobacteria bacterium]